MYRSYTEGGGSKGLNVQVTNSGDYCIEVQDKGSEWDNIRSMQRQDKAEIYRKCVVWQLRMGLSPLLIMITVLPKAFPEQNLTANLKRT